MELFLEYYSKQIGGFMIKPEAAKALAAVVTDKDRCQYFDWNVDHF